MSKQVCTVPIFLDISTKKWYKMSKKWWGRGVRAVWTMSKTRQIFYVEVFPKLYMGFILLVG